jgi:hypothetical protein
MDEYDQIGHRRMEIFDVSGTGNAAGSAALMA